MLPALWWEEGSKRKTKCNHVKRREQEWMCFLFWNLLMANKQDSSQNLQDTEGSWNRYTAAWLTSKLAWRKGSATHCLGGATQSVQCNMHPGAFGGNDYQQSVESVQIYSSVTTVISLLMMEEQKCAPPKKETAGREMVLGKWLGFRCYC